MYLVTYDFAVFFWIFFLQLSSDLYTRNLRKSATRSRLDRSIQILFNEMKLCTRIHILTQREGWKERQKKLAPYSIQTALIECQNRIHVWIFYCTRPIKNSNNKWHLQMAYILQLWQKHTCVHTERGMRLQTSAFLPSNKRNENIMLTPPPNP